MYAPAAQATMATTYDFTAPYHGRTEFNGKSVASNNGIVNGASTASLVSASFDGANRVKIIPKPTGESGKAIMVDHYSIKTLELSLVNLKYISVYCYYDGETDTKPAEIRLLSSDKTSVASTVVVMANEETKKGQWQWLTFDVGAAAYGKIANDTYLQQFHFLPYGNIHSTKLKSSDVFYVSEIRYVSHDKMKDSDIAGVPVSFTASRPDVTGDAPDTIYAKVGDTVTLPKNPYSREDHIFSGWICSADGQKYMPGDKYTVIERNRVSDSSGVLSKLTAEVVFYPDWTPNHNMLSVEYTDYHGGNVSGGEYFTPTRNYEFLGRNTLKLGVVPTANGMMRLDGWNWDKVPFDLDKYKYMTVTYYCDTDNELSFTPEIALQTNGGALSDLVVIPSDYPSVTNQWGVMGFDLSSAEDYLVADATSHILKQFHFYVVGGTLRAKDFNDGDAVYVDTLTLYTEKPAQDLTVVQPVISGDGNGNVRPHSALTRAEAAQIIYNVIKRENIMAVPKNTTGNFSDVSENDWYYVPVAALDTLGVIPQSSTFRPSDKITVGEFMLLLTNINLGGTKAPAFSQGNSGYITRAEAISLVYDILGITSSVDMEKIKVKMFNDLDTESFEYLQILNFSVPRVSSFDSDGNEEVYQLLFTESIDKAVADTTDYLRELDLYEDARIEEIRNTKSVYATRGEAKIYYISSSTGSTSGGSSESNPMMIAELSELASLDIKNGDVVLFKRGDIFRGNLSCVSGVTYSAYGEGEKPRLYRSEKNYSNSSDWVQISGSKVIWRTASPITSDVGGIIINDGEIVGIKEIPSYYRGKYYVRGEERVTEFDIYNELDVNYEFFHDIDGNVNESGYVYFRCEEGNPGKLFESIELNKRGNLISAASNVTIDNLCLKYFGSHGIGVGTVSGLTITNCEIGWGGGSIQSFGTNGVVTRYGNGIEIYGGVADFVVNNCYIHQIYDAGVTHQLSSVNSGNYYMEDVVCSNNVICDSTYSIEYFMSRDGESSTTERFMKNILYENNLLRRAGYGWGVQRPDPAPANIKGWTHYNNAVNFVIKDNIIDRCYNASGDSHLVQMGTRYNGAAPYLEGNTFIQVAERDFVRNHNVNYKFDSYVKDYLGYIGGEDNVVMYAPEDNGK